MTLVARFMCAALVLCTSTLAFAQGLPSDANGFKVGSGRLHPYLQLDTRFVVNPGRYSLDSPKDLVLVFRPGMDLILPSDTLDLKFNGDIEYRRFLGLETEATSDLSTLMGRGSINANINKTATVGVRLRESFLRSADPGNETVRRRLLHIVNDLGVGLDVRPGGGALIFSPDISFWYQRYDRSQDNAPSDPQQLDNVRFIPKLRVSWKFLPKTAVFFEGEANLIRFTATTYNVDSNTLLVHLGASGSITQRIAVLLKLGYGNTLIPEDQLFGDSNFNSFVGQAEFNYLASEAMRFRVGLLRTVQPTPLFKYFDMLRFYIGYNQEFGRFQIRTTLSYNYLSYALARRGTFTGDRHDGDLLADITVSYQLTEWLTISASESANLRNSNYTDNDGLANADYFMNDLFIRLSARY